MKICLLAQTLYYLQGGGHFWVYLNWALGLKSNGADLVWLETIDPQEAPESISERLRILKKYLSAYGLDCSVALLGHNGENVFLPEGVHPGEIAFDADLFINFRYSLPDGVLGKFKRTALIDIDPGLVQHWVAHGQMSLSPHSAYFTIGTTVGLPGSKIPSLGLHWHPIRPCIHLPSWPVTATPEGAPFTTITHWHASEFVSDGTTYYENTKRAGFLPFLHLPKKTKAPLELALLLHFVDPDYARLLQSGWKAVHSHSIGRTPESYQRYIQTSAGEFSICKPSYWKMQTGWISDRTICYLASGKPVAVQNTGPLKLDLSGGGLHPFATEEEAAKAFNTILSRYPEEQQRARQLAEEHFDAKKITARVIEICMSS